MSNLDADSILNHFSHEHPLELLKFQPQPPSAPTVACSGCELAASGQLYCCSTCNYYLHEPCSRMPQELSHSSHKEHKLTLLSSPAYPEGTFTCNACGSPGTGFSYHCRECQVDIHIICALMRSTIKHSAHDHTLSLWFSPPYDTKTFDCDICGGPGSDHWLYRCDSCEFDAHMKCAKSKTQPQRVLAKSTSALPGPPSDLKLRDIHAASKYGSPKAQQQQSMPRTQHRQLPPLAKSRSAPSQCPKAAGHFSPQPPPAEPQFQPGMGLPYVPTQSTAPGIGFSGWPQTYPQGAVQPQLPIFAQNGQHQRTNSILNDIVGQAIEGAMGAITQEVIQSLLNS
ncbi:uncharacterized protein LOC127788974 [Diospyros lotus]|uniref:uncharacterized protein LOC127788974 n=1 Tax=Diospyros lotus TaxID=55363 RepID=UPI002253DC3E|nr:uncharacterized protein LOC127788974 [Diospyros lotus]